MAHLALGIDIGGSKTAFGLVDLEKGKVLEREKYPTEKTDLETFFRFLTKKSLPYIQKGATAVGIAIAGMVEREKGVLVKAPNLPDAFQNMELGQNLKQQLNLLITIDNDAHCFTLAEANFGQGKGKKSIFCLTLGTGIGGGYCVRNELIQGFHNTAGEIGHITIDMQSSVLCSCGQKGHLEALASGSAMTRMYAEKTGENLQATEIEKRALKGDMQAKEVSDQAGTALGIGLATIIQLCNPENIILGGGLVRMPMYTQKARETYAQYLANPTNTTEIVDTELGDDAQLLGAAMLTTRV